MRLHAYTAYTTYNNSIELYCNAFTHSPVGEDGVNKSIAYTAQRQCSRSDC